MKIIYYAIIICALSLYGCKNNQQKHAQESSKNEHAGHNHDHDHDHDHDHNDHSGHNHDEGHEHGSDCDHDHSHGESDFSDEIIFTKEQAARTNFKVEKVTRNPFQLVIKASGQIISAPGDESTIVATNDGVVSLATGNLFEGSEIKKGQTLFYISSQNIGEGDYYTRTKVSYDAALANYKRAQSLVEDRIISQREFEAIELEYNNAKIAFDAVSKNYTSKGIGVSSPIAGFINNLSVSEGEYVTTGQVLGTVYKNRKLTLRAEVSERHYSDLKKIKTANFKTPYDNRTYSLNDMNGNLISYGKSSGSDFYIPVIFEFEKTEGIIPGSFVEVYLLSSEINNTITIPVSALTNEMGIYYVYVQIDEEGYRKQEVTLGANNGVDVQVLNGLQEGERVVVQGAYQVKMASSSGAIPHGHEH